MRTRTTAILVAGALLTGVGGTAATAAFADTDTSTASTVTASSTPSASSGSSTQGQGSARLIRAATAKAAAKLLGLSTDQLRTALQQGQSLAQLATQHGITVDSLVTGMVNAAKTELATAVTDGRLTQAQADAITKTLTVRITDRVNATGSSQPSGHGSHGPAGIPSTGGGA